MGDFYNTVNKRKREEVSGSSGPNNAMRWQQREGELSYPVDLRHWRERVGMRLEVENHPNVKVNTTSFPYQSLSLKGQEQPDR